MVRVTGIMVMVALMAAMPAAAQQHGEVRHSGTVGEIAADDRTIVLEEMLAWQGADKPGVVRRSITLGPATSIQLVERTDEWGEARTSRPGWKSETIDVGDLRAGDFVTVTLRGDARSPAVALEVLRPGS